MFGISVVTGLHLFTKFWNSVILQIGWGLTLKNLKLKWPPLSASSRAKTYRTVFQTLVQSSSLIALVLLRVPFSLFIIVIKSRFESSARDFFLYWNLFCCKQIDRSLKTVENASVSFRLHNASENIVYIPFTRKLSHTTVSIFNYEHTFCNFVNSYYLY